MEGFVFVLEDFFLCDGFGLLYVEFGWVMYVFY